MNEAEPDSHSHARDEHGAADPHAAAPRAPLFERHHAGLIGYGRIDQGDGLAILGALPLGLTLDGVDETHTQRTFLEAMSVGHPFAAFDQRGAGASLDAGQPRDWDELANDLWAVADAADFERVILYGVFDAAYTAVRAAALQPKRTLGLILNFMPPAFGRPDGVPAELLNAWNLSTDITAAARFEPNQMLRDLGLDEHDAHELGAAWIASTPPEAVRARAKLLHDFDFAPLLRECHVPGLIVEPRRRALFNGWGDAVGQAYPEAKVVRPTRGSEALGAIYAYLVLRSLEAGPLASHLSADQSQTVEASERSIRDLNRIVVPVDETVASGRAVNLACRLGESQHAEIVLLHVVTVHRARALSDPPAEALVRGERALEMGTAIAARHHVRWRTQLINQRSLVEGIVRAANIEEADLIVIANPAAESEVDGPLGGIIDELLKRAPCEVLVDRGDRVEASETV